MAKTDLEEDDLTSFTVLPGCVGNWYFKTKLMAGMPSGSVPAWHVCGLVLDPWHTPFHIHTIIITVIR